jgi:hypothetical protein
VADETVATIGVSTLASLLQGVRRMFVEGRGNAYVRRAGCSWQHLAMPR